MTGFHDSVQSRRQNRHCACHLPSSQACFPRGLAACRSRGRVAIVGGALARLAGGGLCGRLPRRRAAARVLIRVFCAAIAGRQGDRYERQCKYLQCQVHALEKQFTYVTGPLTPDRNLLHETP